MYIYIYTHLHIHIHIQRERSVDTFNFGVCGGIPWPGLHRRLSADTYMHTYTRTYIYSLNLNAYLGRLWHGLQPAYGIQIQTDLPRSIFMY